MAERKVPPLPLAAVASLYEDDSSSVSSDRASSYITGLNQVLVLDGGSFQTMVYHIALTSVLIHRKRLTKLKHVMASGPSALFAAHLCRVWPLLQAALQRCVVADRLQLIFDYLSKPFRAHYEKPKNDWVVPMRALAAWEPAAASAAAIAAGYTSPRLAETAEEDDAEPFTMAGSPYLTIFSVTPGTSSLTRLMNIDGDYFAAALHAAGLVETARTIPHGFYQSVLRAVRVECGVSGHGLHVLVSSKTYQAVPIDGVDTVTKFDTSDTEIFPMPAEVAQPCDERTCDLPLVMNTVLAIRRLGKTDALMKQPHARSARVRSKKSLMATPRRAAPKPADAKGGSSSDSSDSDNDDGAQSYRNSPNKTESGPAVPVAAAPAKITKQKKRAHVLLARFFAFAFAFAFLCFLGALVLRAAVVLSSALCRRACLAGAYAGGRINSFLIVVQVRVTVVVVIFQSPQISVFVSVVCVTCSIGGKHGSCEGGGGGEGGVETNDGRAGGLTDILDADDDDDDEEEEDEDGDGEENSRSSESMLGLKQRSRWSASLSSSLAAAAAAAASIASFSSSSAVEAALRRHGQSPSESDASAQPEKGSNSSACI